MHYGDYYNEHADEYAYYDADGNLEYQTSGKSRYKDPVYSYDENGFTVEEKKILKKHHKRMGENHRTAMYMHRNANNTSTNKDRKLNKLNNNIKYNGTIDFTQFHDDIDKIIKLGLGDNRVGYSTHGMVYYYVKALYDINFITKYQLDQFKEYWQYRYPNITDSGYVNFIKEFFPQLDINTQAKHIIQKINNILDCEEPDIKPRDYHEAHIQPVIPLEPFDVETREKYQTFIKNHLKENPPKTKRKKRKYVKNKVRPHLN